MLTPQQVIPFLEHDDPDVRQHAVLYLAGADDPAPATAEDFWRAIDKLGHEAARSHISRLELLPQTDESVRRTIEGLTALPDGDRPDLLRVLRSLDFPLLRRHHEAVSASPEVPQDVKDHLAQRLALADEPAETLWDRLMEQARTQRDKPLTEPDALAAERLIEACARHVEPLGDRNLEILRDGEVKDWREVFCADLAGEMRQKDATDALIDKLREQEADILWETAGEALARIGEPSVVEKIEARFPNEEWGFRLSAASVLGRLKCPQAEASILRLMAAEQDKEVVTFLAGALLDLCPTDPASMEAVRQVVLQGRYEGQTSDLRELLVTVSQIVGYDLPEAAAWREEIKTERARWAAGATDFDGLLAKVQAKTLDRDYGTLGQVIGISDPSPLPPLRPRVPQRRQPAGRRGAATYAPAHKVAPVRRGAEKVGRNDPCPCGSGKKYKKCHGR